MPGGYKDINFGVAGLFLGCSQGSCFFCISSSASDKVLTYLQHHMHQSRIVVVKAPILVGGIVRGSAPQNLRFRDVGSCRQGFRLGFWFLSGK